MSAGSRQVDAYMQPVADAISRHVTYPSDAWADIYNRAYEAVDRAIRETKSEQVKHKM